MNQQYYLVGDELNQFYMGIETSDIFSRTIDSIKFHFFDLEYGGNLLYQRQLAAEIDDFLFIINISSQNKDKIEKSTILIDNNSAFSKVNKYNKNLEKCIEFLKSSRI